MVKILVTGGAGYIGSKIVNDLIDNNYKVVVIDDLSTGHKLLINKKAKFYKSNISNTKKLDLIFKKNKCTHVIHLAAALSVPESQLNPLKYYTNNVLGTENLLKLTVKHKIKFFLFSSTCAVYGNGSQAGIKEESFLLPESNYGKTKLMAEQLVQNYSNKHNVRFGILRYFNVIGADSKLRCGQVKASSLFGVLIKNIISKKYKINLYGNNYDTKDGTCIRDYIDINDLSKLHLLTLKKLKTTKSLILNCGYGKTYSNKKVVNLFSLIVKKKIKISTKPRRKGDVEKIFSNVTKLKKTFPNWTQEFSIRNSIQNSLKWKNVQNEFIKKS